MSFSTTVCPSSVAAAALLISLRIMVSRVVRCWASACEWSGCIVSGASSCNGSCWGGCIVSSSGSCSCLQASKRSVSLLCVTVELICRLACVFATDVREASHRQHGQIFGSPQGARRERKTKHSPAPWIVGICPLGPAAMGLCGSTFKTAGVYSFIRMLPSASGALTWWKWWRSGHRSFM